MELGAFPLATASKATLGGGEIAGATYRFEPSLKSVNQFFCDFQKAVSWTGALGERAAVRNRADSAAKRLASVLSLCTTRAAAFRDSRILQWRSCWSGEDRHQTEREQLRGGSVAVEIGLAQVQHAGSGA
jgi:hypothetical protein